VRAGGAVLPGGDGLTMGPDPRSTVQREWRGTANRLSVVLPSIVFVVSLLIGLALGAAFAAQTYFTQQTRFEARVAELIRSNAAGLTLGLRKFDRQAVDLQLRGMTNTFPVKAAEIVIDGEAAIRTADIPVNEKSYQSMPLIYVSPVDKEKRLLGTLNIYLDHAAANARLFSEIRTSALVVIISSVLLALLVWLAMQRLIAAPLKRLADQLHLSSEDGAPQEVAYDAGGALQPRIYEIEQLVRDINTSRAAAEAMNAKHREAEKRFRDLAEVSSDWFWERDQDLRLTYLSDRFFEVTGIAPEDRLGSMPEDGVDEDTTTPKWQRARALFEQRRPFRDFIYDINRSDGRRLTIRTNGMPIYDDAGNFLGYRGTSSDITLHRIAEEARDDALQRAEQANQAKTEFLATMSHEFRTPLNAILGFSEMIRKEMFGPLGSDIYDNYIKAIHDSGQHMLALVNDVLDISAIEAGHRPYRMESVDVGAVARDCLEEIRAIAADRDIQVISDIAAALPDCHGDRRSIRQIITNLLSNAVKYNVVGGKVTLSAREADGNVEIVIDDTGSGIPADMLSEILKPFTRVDGDPMVANEGAGLGLSIVQSLIEAHGGALTFDSEVGRGTTVRISLQIYETETDD
jgi:PAS domain S-box-containing protein